MKRYACICGNVLFFESSKCLKCSRDVGWCQKCKRIAPIETDAKGGFVCGNPACRTPVLKCDNYLTHNVCNRTVPLDSPLAAKTPPLCDYCQFNGTIPNLSVEGNKAKWARIETAKRRTLYDFDRLKLPYGTAEQGVEPPLVFEFKSDTTSTTEKFRDTNEGEQVFTGHANGVITLNLKEADSVQREKARVEFGEAHRTLIGHFRHEMGHYIWEVAVKDKREQECVELFGDHNAVTYADALAAYYQNGPKPNWRESYVSGYATMHPWEDFAETFANYLDMMATLETAQEAKLIPPIDPKKFDDDMTAYVRLGLALNELNRGIGLVDFLPELMVEPVKKKMAFIHSLTRLGK